MPETISRDSILDTIDLLQERRFVHVFCRLKISLHSKTAKFVRDTLRDLGYGDMLALNFKSEVGIVYSHSQS